jgi:glycosyltransferase involved in cell wall biosynthesis
MRLQPRSLARALLEELRRAGISSDRFDVVDAHYLYPDGVAAACVSEALRLPLVISARGSDVNVIGNIPFARERMVRAANGAAALISVSAALAARMRDLGIRRDHMHVLRNGVDTALFAPFPRANARQHLGLEERCTWVLAVGNLVPEKGFDLLIHAVSRMETVRLLIVGQGPTRQELSSLAARVAGGRVEFRDNVPQSELRFHYAACDVLGVPSLREGWPNVILEAMACGTPVVASRVGGIPEILGPGAPGTMVDERNPDAWTGALRSVLTAGYAAEHVRRHALEFGWEEIVSRQCAVYETIATA